MLHRNSTVGSFSAQPWLVGVAAEAGLCPADSASVATPVADAPKLWRRSAKEAAGYGTAKAGYN
ncbi:MAG: hypothetical protein CO020_00930 [Candidatus Colwellbacteria bacterium CG_4_9_14_0_2_um_filter_50_12]|uniref:Uncharacterized protein n=1 Tax=Candidatus Colwellbacteria bacterium CG_4_9_14_0_2_um_filter_50_12 TaxID=1974538 RepID=A0A2M8G168_9BACT|nr:MAG: hypothetical protein CO020_00930 [Candidatus Colwellbacteria bacterium CG_4_9_14_0_2_um_filter_50_12]